MKGPKAGGVPPSDYLQLVQDFPLYTITSDDQMDRAHAVIDAVLKLERTPGVDSYLDALSVLVATYEDQAHPIPDAPEADVLRVLMDGNGLSQPQLAKEVGIAQSTISDVLSGKKNLTRKQIGILATHFNIAPSAFLPESPEPAAVKPKTRAWPTIPVKASQFAAHVTEELGSDVVQVAYTDKTDKGRRVYSSGKASKVTKPKGSRSATKPKASVRLKPVE